MLVVCERKSKPSNFWAHFKWSQNSLEIFSKLLPVF